MTEVLNLVTAADIMRKDIIMIGPDDSLQEAMMIMTENHIHGLPVLDDRDVCIGVISASDILNYEEDETEEGTAITMALVPYFDPDLDQWSQIEFRGSFENMPSVPVRNVMSTNIISVTPEMGVKDVARLMREHSVHRVLVLNPKRQVVGIISAFDFVHLIADAD